MRNDRPEPEFGPGDSVMILCPAGPPPFPEGPANVYSCLTFNATTEEATYVVDFPNGRREIVDGVELVGFNAWCEWMKVHAN